MKNALLLIIVGAALALSSCKNHYRISVKEPAVIKLPEDTKVIGVINNVTDENSPEKLIAMILGSEQLNGNVAAAERAVDGVLRALSDSRTMRGQIFEIDSTHFNSEGKLNWTVLDSIARVNGIDGFVELSEIRTVSPVGGTVLASATGQKNNKLKGTLFINVHVVSSGVTHERFSVNRSYNVPVSGSTNIIEILNDVNRKKEYYRALGFSMGYDAGELIYPNWVWVGRMYYTRGTPAIKRAKDMLKHGNWDIAEKQLLMDEEIDRVGKRGRVLYNLALVKEAQGEIDLAILFAERASLECGNKEANEYLVKLRQRKRQMEEQ